MEIFNEMEERFVDINGIKLHTVIIGSGEPLMLLHGFPDFWYGWRDIILGLKDKYRLIVPDMRGYNLSDKPEGVENYTLEILVNDIKRLSDALNLGKFSLAGHDWGGPVAWGFAEKYPESLKKLILCNGPHLVVMRKALGKSKSQQKASSYILEFIKPNSEKKLMDNNFQFLKMVVFGMVKKKNAISEFDKEKYIEAWSQPGAINAGLNYYRATFESLGKTDDWTGIINVSTLVIHGMKDIALTPKILEDLSDYVKDLKIVEVENASHWVMVDEPELVISNIKEFLG
ncbi:MAG: alpha/beta hydrolase [Promethearchaeota archaeon]|nr:MAG: alpha/beta hydrolase [Candidatus Lokiarchaeota archaeon]